MAGCNKPSAPEPPFVAKIGEARVTPEEFSAELKKRAARGVEPKPDAILDEMIRTRALLAKARAEGFDRDPEMAARIERMIAAAYEEKLRAGGKKATNTLAEVQEFYSKNPRLFTAPEQARLAGVFVALPSKAPDEKRAEAAKNLQALAAEAAKLPAAEGFGALAAKASEDQASRYQRGDLGWISARQIEERFGAKAAASIGALKAPGEVTAPVDGPGGVWIFRLTERKDAGPRAFAEVREAAAYRLGQQRDQEANQKLEEKIRAGLKIEVNQQEVAKAAASVTNAVQKPPAVQ